MRLLRSAVLPGLLWISAGCRTAVPPVSDVKGAIEITAADKPALMAKGTILADRENHVANFTPELIKRGPLDHTFTKLEGGKLPFPAEMECDFVEPVVTETLSGKSRKFDCKNSDGKSWKVKYGPDNPELYYEVLTTRLFWVLGFFADRDYPVRVICRGCPDEPFTYIKKAHELYAKGQSPDEIKTKLAREHHNPLTLYKEAIVELKTGDKLEVRPSGETGWGFDQLRPLVLPDDYKCEEGQCERIAREGFIALAAFILHLDSKVDNQRIFCMEDGAKGKTVCRDQDIGLMIQDGGASFVGYQFPVLGKVVPVPPKTELELWKKWSIWKDHRPCQIVMPTTPGHVLSDQSFFKATISEDGRKFIADRLRRLSVEQIDALLAAAHIDRRIHPDRPATDPDNREYVFKFREAFIDKIHIITDVTCPYRLETNITHYPK